ncbi:MAG: hypothetical protein IJJ26_11985 [Victivallales bacterium]|nr:hypothetical protein [Victivallales bacterium]
MKHAFLLFTLVLPLFAQSPFEQADDIRDEKKSSSKDSYVITPGKEWQPIDYSLDVRENSALDFSWRLDKPAGKYGRPIMKNGHFEFPKVPGKPLRFYGTNLCFDACYPEHKDAKRLAQRMASFGFNIIRFHHHDGFNRNGNDMMTDTKDSTRLNPDAMDKLDYLYYCLKQQGIYFTTDLYISRRPPAGTFKVYPKRMGKHTTYKALFWISDEVYDNWLKHVTARLTHVNPYTNNTLKDDPALLCVNLINEGNIYLVYKSDPIVKEMYEKLFQDWLKKKQHNSPNQEKRKQLFNVFLKETYLKRIRRAVADLRKLGLTVPISEQIMAIDIRSHQILNHLDYVEIHFYLCLNKMVNKPNPMPIKLKQTTQLTTPWLLHYGLFPGHQLDRPFNITEWEFSKPNNFRAEGPSITSAIGSLQDCDALVQFTYAESIADILQPSPPKNLEITHDPTRHFSHRLGSALFLGQGIHSTSHTKFVEVIERDSDSNGPCSFPSLGELAAVAPIGSLVVSSEAELKQKLPSNAVLLQPPNGFPQYAKKYGKVVPIDDPDFLQKALAAAQLQECYNPKSQTFRTPDGTIEHNRSKGIFRATAPDCETIILPAGETLQGQFLTVANQKGRGVFGAISRSQDALDKTSRVLLLHITNSQATKAKFASPKMEICEEWGTLPFLVSDGQADVSLKLAPGSWKVWAIDTSGKRLAEIPATYQNGTLRFRTSVFNKFGSVFAYELAK